MQALVYPGFFILKGIMKREVKSDYDYMMMAVKLAQEGGKETGKNPKVGCYIVEGGQIIGKGCHEKYGCPHAEVNAVNSIRQEDRSRINDSTFYVTLEPCSHYGKTPPCAKLLAELGPKEVVIAALDPNPKVAGRGVEILLEAGIDVRVGVCQEEARAINTDFFQRMEKENPLPKIMLKMGMSLDGKIATRKGESKWITGPASRQEVQRLRGMADAIITGVNTVIADDPQMTYRGNDPKAKRPVRVLMDSQGRAPDTAKIFDGPPRTIVYSLTRPEENLLKDRAQVIQAPARMGHVDPEFVIANLARQGMKTIMIEAGCRLASSFMRCQLVSDLHLFIAPKLIGADGFPAFDMLGVMKMEDIIELESPVYEQIEEDIYVHGHCGRSR